MKVNEEAREVDEGAREIDEGPGRSMRGPGREGQSSFIIFKPNRTKSYPILQYFILWSLSNICTINHSLNSSENKIYKI